MSDCFFDLPLGFKFAPTDHEIITYLLHKITRTNIRGGELIINAEVFGDLPPWILCQNRGSIDVGLAKYFFTAVKKKGKNGTKNFKRTVGEIGTWRGENKGEEIPDPKNKDAVLGMKRKLTFTTDLEKKFKWLMTEYSLAGEYKEKYACGSDRHDYVICKIKKKIDNRKYQKQVGFSAQEINMEPAQELSHSTIQTADLSQACRLTNMNTNYSYSAENYSQGINSYNVGQQYRSAKNYLTMSNSAQVAYSDSRFVNNPVDPWSASNTIHQNNLQQFFPEDNNLESAQEQSCLTNSAAIYSNRTIAADLSQGIECRNANISNLELPQHFVNEADNDLFDSVLHDNQVNYDEMMNLDTEVRYSKEADDDDEYNKQINEALGMDDVEQVKRVDKNNSEEIFSTDEIRSDVEEITDELTAIGESELSNKEHEADIDEKLEEADEEFTTLKLDESLEKDMVEQVCCNNGENDEFKFMMDDDLPLPSNNTSMHEIRDSTLNYDDLSAFHQFI